MAITKSSTQGIELYRDTVDTYLTEAQVEGLVSVSTPDNAKEQLDSTDLDSTSKEYISGLGDNGEISFSVNIDLNNATHQALIADNNSGTTRYWKIRIPEAGVATYTDITFAGYVGGFSADNSIDAVQNWSGTIVVDGAATFAHAEAA